MIAALLLPLLLGATPATPSVAAAAFADSSENVVARATEGPPIRITMNNDRRFLPGERARVQIRTDYDGYLLVLHADPDGRLRVLFPIDPRDDNFVRGGKTYEILGRGDRESFTVDDGEGRGFVYAAVSQDPYRFEEFTRGDHWDYQVLAPNRLSTDPDPELTDLARRMATGNFDYDVLSYDVSRQVASGYGPVESVYYLDDPSWGCFGCGYYGRPYGGAGFSFSLSFGSPFFFGSYYDPFYDPFFYDPFYYRPFVHRPIYYPFYGYPYSYHYPYSYYRPYRSYPYYGHHYYGDRRFTYTSRLGYRDRRFDPGFQATNTVYGPSFGARLRPTSSSAIDAGRRGTYSPASRAVDGVTRTSPSTGRRADPSATRDRDRGGGARPPAGTGDRPVGRRVERFQSETSAPQPSVDGTRRRAGSETMSRIAPSEPDRGGRGSDRGGEVTARRVERDDRALEPEPREVYREPSRRGERDASPSRAEPRAEPRRAEPRSEPRSEPRRSPVVHAPRNDGGGSSRAGGSRAAPSSGGGGRRGSPR